MDVTPGALGRGAQWVAVREKPIDGHSGRGCPRGEGSVCFEISFLI